MTTQETVYTEIERLVKNFKDMPRENPSTMVDAIREMVLETRHKYRLASAMTRSQPQDTTITSVILSTTRLSPESQRPLT